MFDKFICAALLKTAVARATVLVTVAALLGACTAETSREEASGQGRVRALHAIAELSDSTFLIEELSLGSLNYRGTTAFANYDDLNYQFNFDSLLPGNATALTRLASSSLRVVANTDYTFVLSGTITNPEVMVWDKPERIFDDGTTQLEVGFGHLAAGLDAIDVYLGADGTDVLATPSVGSMVFSERLAETDFEAGDYRMIITARGDAATILFESDAFTLAAATSVLLVPMDVADIGPGQVSVRAIGGVSAELLPDRNASSELRVFNAARDSGAIDVVRDDGFAMPFEVAVGYGELSSYADAPIGTVEYSVTETGNSSAVLATLTSGIFSGSRNTLVLLDPSDALLLSDLLDNNRELAGFAKLRVLQAASQFAAVDMYLLQAGEDVESATAQVAGLTYPLDTGYLQVLPGTYDLVLTEPGTSTIVGAPQSITLSERGTFTVIAVDSADGLSVEYFLLDDFMATP